MQLKKKLLANCKLYLILDTSVHNYDQLFVIAKAAVKAGVDIIQLRDKQGSDKDILRFSKKILIVTKRKIPYIINDRIDLAIISQADGVHLGQDDIALEQARKMMGKKAIIGVSAQSLAHAKKAMLQGADYIGFGSVFKTLTKPERQPMDLKLLSRVLKNITIPLFAIGGITLENLKDIKAIGVKRIAVCRAISEEENIGQVVKSFQERLFI